ncbi:MAG: GntR family transcriptional regulator [Actinomycetota bacterium]
MVLSLQHTDLATAVTQSLREAIVSGELAAGTRLVETDLAAQFGVSRGPIRDALVELQHTGLVELRARKGSFVASFTASDVAEIYSLRSALEALAARQAATTGVDAAAMAGLLDDLAAANRTGEGTRIGAADMALHRGIVAAARNRRLLEAWEHLADQTLLMLIGLSRLDSDIQGVEAHRQIVDDLVAGRADEAAAGVIAHLDTARRIVVGRYEQ